MTRTTSGVAVAVVLLLVAACGEKQQVAGGKRKADTQAWQGANDPYVAPGWKAGDETSWEQHMRARTQGQNEYARAAAQPGS